MKRHTHTQIYTHTHTKIHTHIHKYVFSHTHTRSYQTHTHIHTHYTNVAETLPLIEEVSFKVESDLLRGKGH